MKAASKDMRLWKIKNSIATIPSTEDLEIMMKLSCSYHLILPLTVCQTWTDRRGARFTVQVVRRAFDNNNLKSCSI